VRAPDDERLDEPVLADRSGELVELTLAEVLPRLPFLGDDALDGALEDASLAVALGCNGGRRGQQRVEAST
jgi:hypothetical protein